MLFCSSFRRSLNCADNTHKANNNNIFLLYHFIQKAICLSKALNSQNKNDGISLFKKKKISNYSFIASAVTKVQEEQCQGENERKHLSSAL